MTSLFEGLKVNPFSRIPVSFEILVGSALLLGLMTPLAGVLAASIHPYTAPSCFLAHGLSTYWQAIPAVYLCAISIALMLLAPLGRSRSMHVCSGDARSSSRKASGRLRPDDDWLESSGLPQNAPFGGGGVSINAS